jgi:short-subunit dehydrogenase
MYISDRSSVKDFAKEVSQYGSVDVLINNAGVNLDNEYSAANAQKTMDINYTAMLDVSTIASLADNHGLTVHHRCAKHSSPSCPRTDAS